MPSPSRSTLAHADTIDLLATPPVPVDVRTMNDAELASTQRYVDGAILGQGGMGEVRAVRDVRLGREVAVKVMHGGEEGPSLHGRMRFLREARVQGQLEHPSIVPVYDLEWHADGAARLYMKRVRGMTLEQVIEALHRGDEAVTQRFTRRRLLTAFVSVCRGIDYAHVRGVVHRDIKPSNIMLGEFGEVHVLDWGIAGIRHVQHGDAHAPSMPALPQAAPTSTDVEMAKTMEQRFAAGDEMDTGKTADGTLLGTPGYMSPEQARGDVSLLDARSDVFSLGAVLFEILTLEPLIAGRTVMQKIESTMFMSTPRVPSVVAPNADIPPELDAVCAQCCAFDPENRYASAGAIAEAIDRYLDGDRDVAARRALAKTHVEAAEQALRDAPEGDGDARAMAVRSFTRALALDPQHQMASARLGQLLMDVSGKLPREAAIELESLQRRASTHVAKAGLSRIAALVVLAVFAILLGLRDITLGVIIAIGLTASVLASYLWLHVTNSMWRSMLMVLSAFSVMVALAGLNQAFGPAIFVPMVAIANGLLILGQTNFQARVLAGLTCVIPSSWPFVSGALGIGPWPYDITHNAIVIPSRLVWFPPTVTMGILALFSVGIALSPVVMTIQLRARLRSVEERMFLHSWHLRQLAKQGASGKEGTMEAARS